MEEMERARIANVLAEVGRAVLAAAELFADEEAERRHIANYAIIHGGAPDGPRE